MKRKRITWLLTALLICVYMLPAQAQTINGKDGWLVRFTTGAEMESNFQTADYNDPIHGLQPGDDVNYTVSLRNEYSGTTDWYMTNEVLHSLEDRSNNPGTSGGAYTYTLIYVDQKGAERVLYSSDKVGGSLPNGNSRENPAGEGLHEATDALTDYFYLDTLQAGEQGQVRLNVALEGESQGNDYQDTLADLQMNFAVEVMDVEAPAHETETPSRNTPQKPLIVKTGDETNIHAAIVAMLVSGALIFLMAMYSAVRRRRAR